MQIGMDRCSTPLDRQEAVAEIRLGRRARADAGAGLGHEVELAAVGVRRVDDRRARAEAAGLREQLDGAEAVLGDALLDLARLLVGVDVKRQRLLRRVAAQLLEPVARARAHGVGGDADADAGAAQLLELAEVVGHGVLAEPVDPAAAVGDVEQDELDAGGGRRLGRGSRLVRAEVVELADRRVPGGEHLARRPPRTPRGHVPGSDPGPGPASCRATPRSRRPRSAPATPAGTHGCGH